MLQLLSGLANHSCHMEILVCKILLNSGAFTSPLLKAQNSLKWQLDLPFKSFVVSFTHVHT